jgi:hypothetical protein
MKRFVLMMAVIGTVLLLVASGAWSGPVKLCIPSKEGKTPVTPKGGVCKRGYTLSELPGEQETAILEKVAPHIKYEEHGVGGKPTIQFSGVNVQVVNGEGKTEAVNGEGNLVIGYDENERDHAQTGSHDLVLGEEQTFTSYGGIVAGYSNSLTAALGSIIGGWENHVNEQGGSIVGGEGNRASGLNSSVAGGGYNEASGRDSTVNGGWVNDAEEWYAAVGGGTGNKASGVFASVSGGYGNTASGERAAVSGGVLNKASGFAASVGGGVSNAASGDHATVSGGFQNSATGEWTWIGGGYRNVAEGKYSSVGSGKERTATDEYEAVALGGAILHESSPVALEGGEGHRDAEANVSCPDGEVAVGGGGNAGNDSPYFYNSEPTTDGSNVGTAGHPATGWRVDAENRTENASTITAYVLCVP